MDEQRTPVTTIYMRPSLWKRVRAAAVRRDVKLWEAVEEAMELWLKHGKARA